MEDKENMQRKRNNLQGFFFPVPPSILYNTVLAHYYYERGKEKKRFKESYKYNVTQRNANRKRKK